MNENDYDRMQEMQEPLIKAANGCSLILVGAITCISVAVTLWLGGCFGH